MGSQSLLAAIEPDRTGQVLKGVLELRGEINPAMVQRFREAVDHGGVTALRITSLNGYNVDALVIGSLVHELNIAVIVRDICAGPCATYIFVGARQRSIEPGGLVAFQNTIKSSSVVIGIASRALGVPNSAEPVYAKYAAMEERFYRRIGVDTRLIQDIRLAIQPRCATLRRDGGSTNWTVPNNYALWVPTRSYLQSVGVAFAGDWPASRRQATALASRLLQREVLKFVRFGDEDNLHRSGDKPYSPDDLQDCVMEEVR
jgi:hypothetical protein